jgi:hypothetical protein
MGKELHDLRLVEINHIHRIRNAVRDADTNLINTLYDSTFTELRKKLSVQDSYKQLYTFTRIADTMIASTNGTFVHTYKKNLVGDAQIQHKDWLKRTSEAQYFNNTN